MDPLLEKCAAIEHERWSGWMRYLFSKCAPHTVHSYNSNTRAYDDIPTGGLVIHRDSVKHWQRQIDTPYESLSEAEKESDRIEVRKYLPLLEQEKIGAVISAMDDLLKVADAGEYEDLRREVERYKTKILSELPAK